MSAIVFPGQGSQYISMAIDFNDCFPIAKSIFEEIEEYSKIKIRKIITDNDQNMLNQTNYTQIAVFSASMAIYKTLINQIDYDILSPKIVLGHSLGEYTALVANGTLDLSDASKLIKIRGALMQSAINPNTSGMAAIIGKNAEYVDKIINTNNLSITIANDNSPMQVVISGLIEDIHASKELFISSGVKKFIPLKVSAAFHSNYMLTAQNEFIDEINKISFNQSDIPIISNYDASINLDKTDVMNALKNQMANKVKWTDSIKTLENTKTNKIIEIGPGKVLSGLISRISNKFDIISVDKITDLDKFK